jgi:hypothetical protein
MFDKIMAPDTLRNLNIGCCTIPPSSDYFVNVVLVIRSIVQFRHHIVLILVRFSTCGKKLSFNFAVLEEPFCSR